MVSSVKSFERMVLNNLTAIFNSLGKGSGQYTRHATNSLIIVVTIGFEELSKFLFFTCPCDHDKHKAYGLLFIFGPAFLLWLIGIMAQDRLWRLTTGLCLRKRIRMRSAISGPLASIRSPAEVDVEKPSKFVRTMVKTRAFFSIMGRVMFEALMVPAVWILVCFIFVFLLLRNRFVFFEVIITCVLSIRILRARYPVK